ncbi:hypothetical protein [Demequina salsinemoris]|uniref:hypothetical protein n=1 Tax=Demequina salsinemoris TaxID=577470 RepID=UPI000784D7DD|nr:hypothetical protein [Demequina salsinemoris]
MTIVYVVLGLVAALLIYGFIAAARRGESPAEVWRNARAMETPRDPYASVDESDVDWSQWGDSDSDGGSDGGDGD